MSIVRFSIKGLLAATAFFAIACMTLLAASPLWASLMMTTAKLILLGALVGCFLRKREARAFLIGFAIFGWGYLWLAHWPTQQWTGMNQVWQIQTEATTGNPLATTRLLHWLYYNGLPKVRTPPAYPAGGGGGAMGGGFFGSLPLGPLLRNVSYADDGGIGFENGGAGAMENEGDPEPGAAGAGPGGMDIQGLGTMDAGAIGPGMDSGGEGMDGGGGSGMEGMGGGGLGGVPNGGGYSGFGPGVGFGGPAPTTQVFPYPSQFDFMCVGHALFSLLFAWCGGVLGRWFYRRNQHDET